MQNTADEMSLWRRFQLGEAAALEQLMLQNFKGLYHYGTKYTYDKPFIKDCIQDLFLDLWNRRQSLSEIVNVKPYLMASLRRRLHRGAISKDKLSGNLNDIDRLQFDVEFSIEESLIREETTKALVYEIKSHLSQLPKRQKEVIYLRFFEDLSRDEIAQVMNINPQSVSNLLQEAFKQLKLNWKVVFCIALLLSVIL